MKELIYYIPRLEKTYRNLERIIYTGLTRKVYKMTIFEIIERINVLHSRLFDCSLSSLDLSFLSLSELKSIYIDLITETVR